MDTRGHSWLRYSTTSQKVAGLIPDGIVGFFIEVMGLGSTQIANIYDYNR